ncbi:hypothetical protein [Halomonas hibernica]|uniref:hypothetical protein n=1 Tax=Halomonas hibernica TaxID=2591147 RepID=UPI001553B4B2|nr:hypothetical protein [Halomonas hibernica]
MLDMNETSLNVTNEPETSKKTLTSTKSETNTRNTLFRMHKEDERMFFSSEAFSEDVKDVSGGQCDQALSSAQLLQLERLEIQMMAASQYLYKQYVMCREV